MRRGDLVFIRNCYGIRYNTLAIFDHFQDDHFYFASPWKKNSTIRHSKYITAEFIVIPWSKKIYDVIQTLDFFDFNMNLKIKNWIQKLDYHQLLTHSTEGVRVFAKKRITEEMHRALFKKRN